MPNHVTNVLTLHGEPDKIRAMLEAIQYDDLGIGSVNFNKIIPMPESLNIEAGSQTSTGLKAYQVLSRSTPSAERSIRMIWRTFPARARTLSFGSAQIFVQRNGNLEKPLGTISVCMEPLHGMNGVTVIGVRNGTPTAMTEWWEATPVEIPCAS